MSSLQKAYYTAEQYLKMERKADHKSEYVSGEILAMAGASREHNLIVTNMVRELSGQLRGRPCETYPSDMRVRISDTGAYTYPDVVVAWGEIEMEDSVLDTLLNPTVVIEVLSPSTEGDDRGWKFAQYRRLRTLQEYVLVSQTHPMVEHYARREEGQWVLTEVSGLDESLALPAIDCCLPLAEIYERIEFQDDSVLPERPTNADNHRA